VTRRNTYVQFRASDEEKGRMRELAAAAGFAELSEYCRAMALWDPSSTGSVEVREAEGALEVRRGTGGEWIRVDPAALEAAGWVREAPAASIEKPKPEEHLQGV
jgi:hypothetical protein